MANILIVDDEAQMRKLVRLMLAGGGHDVMEAASGVEALKLLKNKAVDLVITDIVMPDMDGLELIKEIKKIAPAQKVLGVSGGGQNGPDLYLQLAMKFGADRIMLKPFKAKDLLETAAAMVQNA
jgi:CheY-like chemotaxis protein